MFSTVNILILGQRDLELRRVEELAQGLNFSVRITDGVHDALEQTEATDVLIAVESVPTGPTTPVIRRFLVESNGPLCVIIDAFADDKKAYDWMAAGAWHVWRRPIDPQAVQATLIKYGRMVLDDRERIALKAEVAKLKRWVAGLVIAVAGLNVLEPIFGDQLVAWLMSLL